MSEVVGPWAISPKPVRPWNWMGIPDWIIPRESRVWRWMERVSSIGARRDPAVRREMGAEPVASKITFRSATFAETC